MKLLLILDRVEYPLAPNPRLACRVGEQLALAGHTVDLLELNDGAAPPLSAPWAASHRCLPFADEACMERCLEHGNPGGTPVPVRLLRLAAHPAAALAVKKLGLLAECEMHLTHLPTPGDEAGLRKLGINVTSEPQFASRDLFID